MPWAALAPGERERALRGELFLREAAGLKEQAMIAGKGTKKTKKRGEKQEGSEEPNEPQREGKQARSRDFAQSP